MGESEKKKKSTLAIIDADSIIFFAGYGLRDQLTNMGKIAIRKKVDDIITAILTKCNADYYIGFYGISGGTFRHRFATEKPYKGGRPGEPWQEFFKPVVRAHFSEKWGFYSTKDLEADDSVIIALRQYQEDYNIIMVGEDKDMLQIGKFTRYNPRHHDLEYFTQEEGRKKFWQQMLHGEQSPLPI